jgi:hypothetical protein
MGEKVYSGYLINYGVPNSKGIIYEKGSISKESLDKLIKDESISSYEIDHVEVKVKKIFEDSEIEDRCIYCDNVLDEMSEHGMCFTCVMSACTPGNHY